MTNDQTIFRNSGDIDGQHQLKQTTGVRRNGGDDDIDVDRCGCVSKAGHASSATVDMDSTDSSTEVMTSLELSQSERLDTKLSFSSADDVPSLVEEDSHVAVVKKCDGHRHRKQKRRKKKNSIGGSNNNIAADSGKSKKVSTRTKKNRDFVETDEYEEKMASEGDSAVSRSSSNGVPITRSMDCNGHDEAPSTPPPSTVKAEGDDADSTVPYLPELSPSDGTTTSVGGRSDTTLPKLSARTSYYPRPRRARIVSLDRGRSEQAFFLSSLADHKRDHNGYRSNDSASIHTDGGRGRRHSHYHPSDFNSFDRRQYNNHTSSRYDYGHQDDDDSYSDDDDSYFAKHNISPKSGRSFSLSSAASAPARTDVFPLTKQESDASLSFSDESDDEGYQQRQHSKGNIPDADRKPINIQQEDSIVMDWESDQKHHSRHHRSQSLLRGVDTQGDHPSLSRNDDTVHLAQVQNTNRAILDMNLYPQRITRMHSVSSLVSDDDVEDDESHYTEDGFDSRSRASTSGSSVMSSIASASDGNGMVVSDDAMEAAAAAGKAMARSAGVTSKGHIPSIVTQSLPLPTHDGILGLEAYNNHSPHREAQKDALSNEQTMSWIVAASPTRTSPSSGPLGLASSNTTFAQTNSLRFESMSTSAPFDYTSRSNEMPMSGVRIPTDTKMTSSASGSIPLVYSDDEDQAYPGYYAMTVAASSCFLPTGKQASTFGNAAIGAPPSAGPGGGESFGVGRKNEPGRNRDLAGSIGNGNRETSNDAAIFDGEAAGASALDKPDGQTGQGRQTFKVYWQRWIMLMYMSVLNLLSDWTCYSVAPISLLTEEAFGSIDPERLVVVFLTANAIATACEPIILARLGLRRTVLLGALLLMIGSIVKSGGLPPIIPPNLEKGHAEFSLYLGFFVVGLSQPLYQCTPALLSASWFPEKERTMATGVALNANQLGIGFAFIFGTLLVAKADDIPGYFGLLSQISTLVFIGTLIQFDDAPPTPPSSSARAMRGDFRMPHVRSIVGAVRSNISRSVRALSDADGGPKANAPSPANNSTVGQKRRTNRSRMSSTRSSTSRRVGSTRRRSNVSGSSHHAIAENGLSAPSSAHYGSTMAAIENAIRAKAELSNHLAETPSPAPMNDGSNIGQQRGQQDDHARDEPSPLGQTPRGGGVPPPFPVGPYGYAPPPYQYSSYWPDPRFQQQQFVQQYFPQPYYQQQPLTGLMGPPSIPPPPQPGHPPYPFYPSGHPMFLPYIQPQFPPVTQEFDPHYMYNADPYDDGAEPIISVTDHHLDINIRDDQVIRSLHACMTRRGFSHALAAFTVSGIVINTLSTFMDYLVRLNGAPRTYTGIVGGTFQFVIMISSLIVGKQTDKTRAYYSVTIAMLVLGAFGLAECGVSLDSDRGSDLRWSLVVVAALVGPLQPVSTELGVEVAYPLSENTVLVIQQLFSNLLSAIFIPFFKALKNVGSTSIVDGEVVQHPDYTFSFYLLIVLHTGVTVYFATFNGSYLRYEHEVERKDKEEREDAERESSMPVHPFFATTAGDPGLGPPVATGEEQPLLQSFVV